MIIIKAIEKDATYKKYGTFSPSHSLILLTERGNLG
jgi:hypothetical protein